VRKLVLISIFAVAVSACSVKTQNKSGVESNEANKGYGTPELDQKASGSFKASSPKSKPAAADIFTIGCKVPGTFSPDFKIHPHLSRGNTTHWTATKSYPGHRETLVYSQVTEQVSADSVAETIIYSKAAGHPAIRDGMTFHETCRLPAGKQKEECTPDSALPARAKVAGRALRCWIETQGNKSARYSDSVGAFKTTQGKNFNAFLERMSVQGEIQCEYEKEGTKKLGRGTQSRLVVYSNNVVLDHFDYCGGSTVFWATRVTDQRGHLLFASQVEATDMPVIDENSRRTDTKPRPQP
jgi:hypothetical protein